MASLKIASYNVRGLGNDHKRREIFHYPHSKQFDIVLAQETHSAVHLQKRWKAEWGGKILFSHGTSQARGTMILISKQVNINIHNVVKDINGRFFAIDIMFGESRFMITNIYAPNLDNPSFFMNTFNKIDEMGNSQKIIAGNFSLVLNEELDRKGGDKPHAHKLAPNYVRSHIAIEKMVDARKFYHVHFCLCASKEHSA